MREKLKIAKQLNNSRKYFSNNVEHKKLCSKCYYTYIVECIIKGQDNFKISFEGKYIESFPKRLSDWCNYLLDSLYRIYLVNITPNDDKTFKKYELIHYGVIKPVHFRLSSLPNETILNSFLMKNGFKITAEHLYSECTVYDVTRI